MDGTLQVEQQLGGSHQTDNFPSRDSNEIISRLGFNTAHLESPGSESKTRHRLAYLQLFSRAALRPSGLFKLVRSNKLNRLTLFNY